MNEFKENLEFLSLVELYHSSATNSRKSGILSFYHTFLKNPIHFITLFQKLKCLSLGVSSYRVTKYKMIHFIKTVKIRVVGLNSKNYVLEYLQVNKIINQRLCVKACLHV